MNETEQDTLVRLRMSGQGKSSAWLAQAIYHATDEGRDIGLEAAAAMLESKAKELRGNNNSPSITVAMIFEEQAKNIRLMKSSKQQRLGPEFEAAIFKDLEGLYED